MSNEMDFMVTLNDDCLDCIFKILPLSDRINLILTYRMFYDIFLQRMKIEYKSNLNTSFFNTLKTCQLKILLVIIGAHTKHLVVEFPFEERTYLKEFIYFKFLFEFCINVESLSYYGWEVSDEYVKSLRSLNNLKSLAFINSYNATGKYISDLKDLEKLTINNCPYIEAEYLQQIFQNLTNLVYLNIRNCHKLTTQHYQQIYDNLKQLKTLVLSTTHKNLNCLAKLPNLKQLDICRNNILSAPINGGFLQTLVQQQAQQLEDLKLTDCAGFNAEKAELVGRLSKLKILHCTCPCDDEVLQKFSQLKELEELVVSNCCFVNDESVLQLLKNCFNLKRMNLKYCSLLTADFIVKILRILQEQRQLRTKDIQHTYAAEKTVFKFVEIDLEDSTDFVQFSYTYMNPEYKDITNVIKIIK